MMQSKRFTTRDDILNWLIHNSAGMFGEPEELAFLEELREAGLIKRGDDVLSLGQGWNPCYSYCLPTPEGISALKKVVGI